MGRNKSLNNGGSFYLRTEVASNEKGEYAVYLQYTLDRKVEEKLDFSDIVRSKAGEGEGLASEKSPSASQTQDTCNISQIAAFYPYTAYILIKISNFAS